MEKLIARRKYDSTMVLDACLERGLQDILREMSRTAECGNLRG